MATVFVASRGDGARRPCNITTAPRFVVDIKSRQVLRLPERDERIAAIEAQLQSGGGSHELTEIVAKMRDRAREAEHRGRQRLGGVKEAVRAEGYPENDDDVEYLLEDATGLGRGVYTGLKGALLERLRVVREVAGVCWSEVDTMITHHARLRPMAISDVEAQRRFVIGRFLKARQDIINKYQSYLRNLKWLQLASSRQRRGCLTPKQNNILRVWLFSNFQNPYPEPSEKADLSRRTELTATQINNWFINARVRVWKPTVELMTGERMRRETPAPPSPPRGGGVSNGSGIRRISAAEIVPTGPNDVGTNGVRHQLPKQRLSLPAIPPLPNREQAHAGHDLLGGEVGGGIMANGQHTFHRQMDAAANILVGAHKGHLPPQPSYSMPQQQPQFHAQQNYNSNVAGLKNTGGWAETLPGPLLSAAGEAGPSRLQGVTPDNLPAIGGPSSRIDKQRASKKRSSGVRDINAARLPGLSRGGGAAAGFELSAVDVSDRPLPGFDYSYPQQAPVSHQQQAPVSHQQPLYQPYNHPQHQQNAVDPYARHRFQDQNQYHAQQNHSYSPYGEYMQEPSLAAGANGTSLIPPQDQVHRVGAGAQYHLQYLQHQQQPPRRRQQPVQHHQPHHQTFEHQRGYEPLQHPHQGHTALHAISPGGYAMPSIGGDNSGVDRPLRPSPAGQQKQQGHPEHQFPPQLPFSQMIHHPSGQEEGRAQQAWGSAPGPQAPWNNTLGHFPTPSGGS